MSDPIQIQGTESDTGVMDAPDLPLSNDLDQGDGGAAFEPAGTEPAAEPTPSQLNWFERHSTSRETRLSGYRERQRQTREENRRMAQLLAERDKQDADTKRMLIEAINLAKGRQQPEEQAEIPDPALDPPGFQKWWQAQTRAELESTMKPVLDFVQSQQQLHQQTAEERAFAEEQRAIVEHEISTFQAAAAAYAREEPDLAAGAEDRFRDGQALLAECFGVIGADDPAGRANQLLFSVAASARAVGDNEVAAMDGFLSALYYGVSNRLVQAGLMEQPLYPMGGGAPAPAPAPVNGNGHHRPNPAQAEAARIETVRHRTRAAGSVAPREPSAGPATTKSEAQQVYDESRRATGAVDWGKVRAAAIRDAGGDEKAAAAILARLRPSR